MSRLDELKPRVKQEHMDMYKNVLHAVEAIDNAIKEHDQFVAIQAIEGVKPNGIEEKAFHHAMYLARTIIIDNLTKTLDDLDHLYDKGYEKNFKDGVK